MKKYLLLIIAILLVAGCSNPIKKSEKEKYHVYEIHLYDTDFNHTEDAIAKYDKNGDLVYYEESVLYDKVTKKDACDSYDVGKQEAGNDVTCKTTDEGTRISYIADKEYFDNNKDKMDDVDDKYKKLLKEETAKELFNDALKQLKEEVDHSDKYNYVIINGKKMEW